jgi:hypothetical protein
MTEKAAAQTPRLLPFAEADAVFGGALSRHFLGDHDTVLLFDGDLTVEGDFLPAIEAMTGAPPHMVAVNGNLTVGGRIWLEDYTPGLFVKGFTRAETLEGGNAEIYIQDGAFTYLVYGFYIHGTLQTGVVETPWVITSSCHDMEVTAPNARSIMHNYHFSGAAEGYDFDKTNIVEAFVPEIVNVEYNSIDVKLFLERLRAGQPVLSPDF